jgi:hypothetical protein
MIRAYLLLLLRGYKALLSPLLPNSCRFVPTCSEYAADAIAQYGAFRGVFKSLWRILRCHPFSAGGYDPAILPEKSAGEPSCICHDRQRTTTLPEIVPVDFEPHPAASLNQRLNHSWRC